jgi:hypothetical protein
MMFALRLLCCSYNHPQHASVVKDGITPSCVHGLHGEDIAQRTAQVLSLLELSPSISAQGSETVN